MGATNLFAKPMTNNISFIGTSQYRGRDGKWHNVETKEEVLQNWKKTPTYRESSKVSSNISDILGLTALGGALTLGADLLFDPIVDKYNQILDTKNIAVSASPSVENSPSLSPFSPSTFNFSESNSPAMGAGIMQSSEMISQAIASLTQIMYEDGLRRDSISAQSMANQFEQNERIITNLIAMNIFMERISDNLDTYSTAESLNALVEPLGAVAGAVANLPQTNDINITNLQDIPVTDMSLVNQWAEVSKQNELFKQTPINITDSDGDLLSNMSPQELRAKKDAQLQKHIDDKNTYSEHEDNFNPLSLLGLVTMPFVGRESVFDKDANISVNPFLNTNSIG